MYQTISVIRDLVTIVSLIVAACVAIKGLQTWRSQLTGTAEYDLAKRILKATYKLRNALESVRNPLMTVGEISHAVKEANIDTDPKSSEYSSKSNAAVYSIRWKKVTESLAELQEEAIEAEALWGSTVGKQILEIRSSVMKLYSALNIYLAYSNRSTTPEQYAEVVKKFEKIVYKMTDEETSDEFSTDLIKAIDKIENLVKPYLKRVHRKSQPPSIQPRSDCVPLP